MNEEDTRRKIIVEKVRLEGDYFPGFSYSRWFRDSLARKLSKWYNPLIICIPIIVVLFIVSVSVGLKYLAIISLVLLFALPITLYLIQWWAVEYRPKNIVKEEREKAINMIVDERLHQQEILKNK